MTEEQNLMIDAAMQVGFEPINDDATEFRCTQDQLVDMITRARKAGQRDVKPEMVREVRAGPLRAEAARYGEAGNVTFSLTFDNDLMAWMGEGAAQFFAGFVRETLNIDDRTGARELLQEAARMFRFYEQNHRAKPASVDNDQKADRNAKIARQIEDFLNAH